MKFNSLKWNVKRTADKVKSHLIKKLCWFFNMVIETNEKQS